MKKTTEQLLDALHDSITALEELGHEYYRPGIGLCLPPSMMHPRKRKTA